MQPTRGLDVGAIEGVHRLLLAQREAGAAILLISEDLDEILALSDRIAVIYEGRILGVFETRLADVREIGLLMTGGRSSAPPEAPRDGPASRAQSDDDAAGALDVTTAPVARRVRNLSPVELRLERRLDVPRWLPLAASIGAVVVALVIGGVHHRRRRRRPDRAPTPTSSRRRSAASASSPTRWSRPRR